MKKYTTMQLYERGILTLQEVVEEGEFEDEWLIEQLESWFEQDQKRFDQIREQNAVALKYGWTALLTKPS
jgi:hypothetical protein